MIDFFVQVANLQFSFQIYVVIVFDAHAITRRRAVLLIIIAGFMLSENKHSDRSAKHK